jgi:hypothetical protein
LVCVICFDAVCLIDDASSQEGTRWLVGIAASADVAGSYFASACSTCLELDWRTVRGSISLYEITMDAVVEDVGRTPAGHRRFVRVTGGTFAGPKMHGTVLPGGGDWVLERPDGTRALDVRIMLQTHDGDLIYAHYPGRFHGQPDVMRRLARGEHVDASEYYFRVALLFETASEKYAWLNHILAIGVGRRTSDQVSYRVYAVG